MSSIKLSKLRILKQHYFPVLAIIGLTFFVWHKVLNQTFLGEAYSYFAPYWNFFVGPTFPFFDIWYYNNAARLIFDILPPIFGDNIQLYLLFQLLVFLGIYLSVYFVLFKITKSKLIGFSAAVFFMANYIASFEMMATGNYQRFGERVMNFIPTIISFYYLVKFYDQKKIKDLLFSLSLYSLAVIMSHYNTMLLPLVIVYPLVYWTVQKNRIKYLLLGVGVAAIFAGANLFFISKSPFQPNQGFVSFILNEDRLIEKVLYQLPYLTFSYDVIKNIARLWPEHLYPPYTTIVQILLFPTLIIYCAGAILALKKSKKLFCVYLTAFLGGLLSVVLYMYIDDRLNVLVGFGEDRHFFVFSLFLSITWGILLKIFFSNPRYKIIPICLLTIFVVYNTSYIWKGIDDIQYKSEMMKRYVHYMKTLSNQFNDNTIVFVPAYLLWPSPMIASFYGHPKIQILPFPNDDHNSQLITERMVKNKSNVYVITYDFEKVPGKDFDPQKGKVVDLTAKYQNEINSRLSL